MKELTYQEQTYASPSRLVRYAHRRRMEIAVEWITAARPSLVLDYGAGDGELELRLLADPRASSIETVLALEPAAWFREDLHARLGDDRRVVIVASPEEASQWLSGRKLDVITCLQVLEHLTLGERERFYRLCGDHLSDAGRCVINVPVEIGPALMVKQLGRRVLKGRDPEYRPGELLRAVAGIPSEDPRRFDASRGDEFLPHKGFDHRSLRRELEQRQRVTHTRSTPMRWLPAWLCNQDVFFVAEPRSGARSDGV